MSSLLADLAELAHSESVVVIADNYERRGCIGASRYTPVLSSGDFAVSQVLPSTGNSPLVPLKKIPRVHLVRHICELVAPAVGDDHVAADIEGLQVVGHLGAEELRRVQRGLINHHGQFLAFTRFMIPWMELTRRESELSSINRQRTPKTGFPFPASM